MKNYFYAIFAPLLAFMGACSSQSAADLIVYNAQIYTVDSTFSKATALAVKDGKFVAIGDSATVFAKYQSDSLLNAQNKPLYPGFYDGHAHFYGLGQMLDQADLVGAASATEAVQRLQKYQAAHPDRVWLIGRGWDQNDWQIKTFPTKEMLDKAFPDQPVYLTRVDGHAAWVNSKALQLVQITAKSKVEGGLVELDKDGQPTGILVDNAMRLARTANPKPTPAEMRAALLKAQEVCFEYGLTNVGDAGLSPEIIDLIDQMHQDKTLKIRLYAMVSLSPENVDLYLKKGVYQTDRLNVRSFKIYADGALGSRGACLLKPYNDAPSTGFLLLSPKELETYVAKIANSDFQANTHCIGDSANRLMLNLYAKYLKKDNNRRWRIEHAQIVNPADVPTFKNYRIIPSVQPTHATSDMYWASDRLGAERARHGYAFKELYAQNQLITFGTDFPVEPVSPFYTFHSAVFRQDAKGYPASGYQMENALDRATTLRGMTIWAAYGNFEEARRGSIEVGKDADFVILEKDLMTAPAAELRDIRAKKTYVAGQKVFDRP
ncbi:MAG: amidohydrolase [Cytophagia bacterium]|nr:MAG: amidohydrolase [Runella sp.]TAG19484.1 MAG: amidohydrolase [Cytophagales bacterium]TAG38765.1 MAG: amidohydrolase [Cytophagia bacterium]TAG58590.1 MAG: amidohydrolase [Runella slithyformis]TAG77763.1 MAG: amidohydrolase [Cytophagales bacterium]